MVRMRPGPLMPRISARWCGLRVGLYGGSFNPGHEGHAHIAVEALKRLELDAVWLMVSPGNPLKPVEGMAPFAARLESAREVADVHSRVFATDIELHLGTRRTADTVFRLKTGMPRTRFVWIMGADNLAGFHTWYRWRDIVRTLPIAIFDRPGYSLAGLNSRLALRYRRFRVPPHRLTSPTGPAWSFLRIPRSDASATSIRAERGLAWVRDVSPVKTSGPDRTLWR